jgi:peptide methionine sulfoxide reductase msrA/msrB
MKYIIIIAALFSVYLTACSQNHNNANKNNTQNSDSIMEFKQYNPLTEEEIKVIKNKGTERPFTGELYHIDEKGIYSCKNCDAPLYKSDSKCDAQCGWPSFDDEIEGAVKRQTDADGHRTEILCANCGAHLGHVFEGEGFTPKNTRHCVNSISLNFVAEKKESRIDTVILASGCFWGVEFHLQKIDGVISTEVGYAGGSIENPTYEQVCSDTTGHAEVVKVIFDKEKTSFRKILKVFFETHDFTQVNRQGPDIGSQYRSEIFYFNEEQKETAEKVIKILEDKGYKVATKLTKKSNYFKAENYHQDYYNKKGGTPYCHIRKKIF